MPASAGRKRRVQRLVRHMREDPQKGVELEVRLGVYENGAFQPDVGADLFERVRASLDASEFVEACTREAFHDYFYNVNGCQHRTRVCFDTDNMKLRVNTVAKHTITTAHMPPAGPAGQRLSLRVQLSSEKPPCAALPSVVNPSMVRLTNRFSYVHGAWRYDLSAVASGCGRTEAEARLRAGELTYVIECELVDRRYLEGRSDTYVARSLRLKMQDICPNLRWKLS